jgi:hypothetical protein
LAHHAEAKNNKRKRVQQQQMLATTKDGEEEAVDSERKAAAGGRMLAKVKLVPPPHMMKKIMENRAKSGEKVFTRICIIKNMENSILCIFAPTFPLSLCPQKKYKKCTKMAAFFNRQKIVGGRRICVAPASRRYNKLSTESHLSLVAKK